MTSALNPIYHNKPYSNFAFSWFQSGDSKQASSLSSCHSISNKSLLIQFTNSSAQFFLSGIIMIPFPPVFSFSSNTKYKSLTGHPKYTISLPTIKSQVFISLSLSLQSKRKDYTFSLFFSKLSFIVSTTCGWQSVISTDRHCVHFFIVIPAMPTPEPSSSIYLCLNTWQLRTAQRANTMPAYQILSPSRPCGKTSTSLSLSFILSALCMIIYCILIWMTTLVLCYRDFCVGSVLGF